MNAKQCDRCKCFYVRNIVKARKGNRNIKKVATIDDHINCDQSFDLCDDCIADFYKFMDSKEVE